VNVRWQPFTEVDRAQGYLTSINSASRGTEVIVIRHSCAHIHVLDLVFELGEFLEKSLGFDIWMSNVARSLQLTALERMAVGKLE
jgi:hypothetical protein